MQSSSVEMGALLAAFQLPKLHPDIPINPLVTRSSYDTATLARILLEAKIIRPHDVPASAVTAEDVVLAGLGAWFKRRTQNVRHLKFGISLHLGESAIETVEIFNMHGGGDRTFNGNPVLVLTGGDQPFYRMDIAADALEAVCPGLFSAALDAIERASYRTVQLRTPWELWNHVCYRYWDCDWSEVPTDKEARPSLIERFGEDDVIEAYLPSVLGPIFGHKLCAHWPKAKRRQLGRRKLKTIGAESPSGFARKVARQTSALQASLARAAKMEAELPDLSGVDATCIAPAANLLFTPKNLAYEVIDELVNDSWNAGDGTEMIGVHELPTSAEDLTLYFNKLDVAFDVLRHMDKLIALITQSTEPEYD